MKRIRVKDDAPQTPIIGLLGEVLGTFIPGLHYWVTAQNKKSVEKLVANGHAEAVDPDGGPLLPDWLRAESGHVKGTMEVKDAN
jgi:hypothetical protein